ncbi:unnamed protein product [Lampetra planeri]
MNTAATCASNDYISPFSHECRSVLVSICGPEPARQHSAVPSLGGRQSRLPSSAVVFSSIGGHPSAIPDADRSTARAPCARRCLRWCRASRRLVPDLQATRVGMLGALFCFFVL